MRLKKSDNEKKDENGNKTENECKNPTTKPKAKEIQRAPSAST